MHASEGGAFAPAQQLGDSHWFEFFLEGPHLPCGVACAPAIWHGRSEREEASGHGHTEINRDRDWAGLQMEMEILPACICKSIEISKIERNCLV